MATVNLGNIKLNWKGAYNSSTAYIVDDVVSYNGSSYVCILASTGNLPTVTTYWNQMSAAGTDGTDVGTTITTQGDILYRDASGLARLAAGTSGQVLQTGGSGANPSWGTVSSDFVKLAGVDLSSSTANYYNFANFIDDSVYRMYKINVLYKSNTGSGQLRMRFLNNTSAYTGANDYRHAGSHLYRRAGDNSENNQSANSDADGKDYALINSWNNNTGYWGYFDINILGTTAYMGWQSNNWGRDNTGGSSGDYIFYDENGGFLDNSGTVNGVQFYISNSSAYLHNTQFTVWGLKK